MFHGTQLRSQTRRNSTNNAVDYKIDLVGDDGIVWAQVEIGSNTALVGMYEDGKIARQLFTIDRDQARQLVKILDGFAHEWL